MLAGSSKVVPASSDGQDADNANLDVSDAEADVPSPGRPEPLGTSDGKYLRTQFTNSMFRNSSWMEGNRPASDPATPTRYSNVCGGGAHA